MSSTSASAPAVKRIVAAAATWLLAENVRIARPFHDRLGVGKATFIFSNTKLPLRVFHLPLYTAWKAELDEFAKMWEDFFLTLNAFHSKARMMWETGAYDRDALNALADEVDKQKSDLLTAWRRKDRLFYKLNSLNDEIMRSAQVDATTAPKVKELVN